jgi:Protein of unknown function (DUF732)
VKVTAKKRRMSLAALVVASTFSGGALTPPPRAHAVPAPDIEFIYDTTVRKQFSFANTTDAISYAHGICDKISGGASYAQVVGDVKRDVLPNDEYSANYLVSNAVNIYCPAQLWQLRNSAATYAPPG